MKSKIRARPAGNFNLAALIAEIIFLISSLIIAGISSFFTNALLRENMPIPYPIILIMSSSYLNIALLLATSTTRCFYALSPLLLFIFHLTRAVLWIITIAVLGDELGEHLTQACPSVHTFGHDLHLVCNLFKTVFAIAHVAAACAIFLVILDVLAWRQMKKEGSYSAIGKNKGGMGALTMRKEKKNFGILLRMFKKSRVGMQEEESNIMMQPLQSEAEDKGNEILKSSEPNTAQSSSSTPPFDLGPRERVLVDRIRDRYRGMDTRYDPGHRMF